MSVDVRNRFRAAAARARRRYGRIVTVVCVVLASLPMSSARADLLFLKNGEELEGFYIREADGLVESKLADGTDRNVPRVEVERLQLGFTGVPLCYSLREKPAERICNVLLHEIRGNEMIIADEKGYVKLRSVRLDQVGFAELNRVGDFQKIAPLLKKNLKIRATQSGDGRKPVSLESTDPEKKSEQPDEPPSGEPLPDEPGPAPAVESGTTTMEQTENSETSKNEPRADEIVEGSIAEIRGDSVMIRDSKGELREIEDDRIQLVAFQGPPEEEPPPVREFRYSDLYPGIPQIGADRTMTGYAMFGGFHTALFGILWEYRAAQAASAKAQGDLTVLLFNNTSYLEEFNRHQQNQKMFGLLAGAFYVWHLVDWFYLGPRAASPVGQSETPAILFDGQERSDGEYREEIYRIGLRMSY